MRDCSEPPLALSTTSTNVRQVIELLQTPVRMRQVANHLPRGRCGELPACAAETHFDLALSSIDSTTSSNMLSVFGLSARYSFQAVCCANRNQAR